VQKIAKVRGGAGARLKRISGNPLEIPAVADLAAGEFEVDG
jgi:hypothetical protein